MRSRGPRAGGQLHVFGDLVEHLGGQAGQRADPLMQRFGEVEFAAHGRIGDRGDRVQRARPRGEHLDDFLLDQCRVDVEHDEPFGAPRDAVVLQRHVDAGVGGHPRQHFLQLAPDPGRHGDPQLQAGDRDSRRRRG